VNSTVSVPYDWLKTLPREVLNLDGIPLFGYPPPFPWDSFSLSLSKIFEVNNLEIHPGDLRWRKEEELFKDLGDNLFPLRLTVSGFDGEVCWVMEGSDITRLMMALLNKDLVNTMTFGDVDPDFQEGFYRFLAAEAIHSFSNLNFDKTLTPHILKEKALPTGEALGLDIKISLGTQHFIGRFLISPAFRNSWKEHYSQRKQNVVLSQNVAQKVYLSLHVEIGKVEVPSSEWTEMSIGDFIILDTCSADPQEDKGKAILTLNGIPMFRVRLKPHNVKILEFPLSYHEEYAVMEKEPPEEEKEWEEESEEDFDEEEPEEETEFEEDDENHQDEEDDAEQEFEEGFHDGDEEQNEEEDLEGEEEIDELELKKEEDEGIEAESTVQSPKQRLSPLALTKEKTTLSLQETPVNLVIEVGRIQISVGKLLELQPGNLLDLNIKPENGVDLVINGRCIGKGELLRVGETLGVRVLDLAKN
jgi:flagellar motor switch protein FliN/FliY